MTGGEAIDCSLTPLTGKGYFFTAGCGCCSDSFFTETPAETVQALDEFAASLETRAHDAREWADAIRKKFCQQEAP